MGQLELYRSIAEQYRKFDFTLERCLMTEETMAALKAIEQKSDTYLGVAVTVAEIDAMWFSRPSGGKTTAWEIRLVSTTPLSILEKIPDSESAERGAKFKEMETRLSDLISHRREVIEEIIAENAGAADDEDDDDDEETDKPARDNLKPKGNGRYK